MHRQKASSQINIRSQKKKINYSKNCTNRTRLIISWKYLTLIYVPIHFLTKFQRVISPVRLSAQSLSDAQMKGLGKRFYLGRRWTVWHK